MIPKPITLTILAAILGLHSSFAQETASPAPSAPASSPAPERADEPMTSTPKPRFLELHQSFLQRAKAGPIGVLFLGDSITERWAKAPEVFTEHFDKYQPANFGIGGDKAQGVLWRIAQGEFDGIDPKVVVLQIGTNNTAENPAPDIVSGVNAIIREIQTRLPHSKLLLLGIFPRGPRDGKNGPDDFESRMVKIRAINRDLAKLENGNTIRYLDLTPKFLDADGKIPKGLMPDQLHPSAAGYKIWADTMQPLLDEMMAGSNNP